MARRETPLNHSRKHLIDTGELSYAIELVLTSGYLKNADPLSARDIGFSNLEATYIHYNY